MPNDPACYDKYLKSIGWAKQKQPKRADGKKFTVEGFLKVIDTNCIVSVSCHLLAIKDGKVWDTWDSTHKCVCGYWVKEHSSKSLYESAMNTSCSSRIECLPINQRSDADVKERLDDIVQTSQYWLNELDRFDNKDEYEYWKKINHDAKRLLKSC